MKADHEYKVKLLNTVIEFISLGPTELSWVLHILQFILETILQPLSWLVQNTQLSQLITWQAVSSNRTEHNYYQGQHKKVNNHAIKLLTYMQTKANENKTWFNRFVKSDQEMHWAYSRAPGTCTELFLANCHSTQWIFMNHSNFLWILLCQSGS